jgi:Protein of unknown function (DUF1496)
LNKFTFLVLIGILFAINIVFLLPQNINGQNTANSTLANELISHHLGASGVNILDTKGLNGYYSFCLYDSQLYSVGAVINMAGMIKTCSGSDWH